jgi:hypothetical protein
MIGSKRMTTYEERNRMTPDEKAYLGAMVLFVMPEGKGDRPALITRLWPNNLVNLQVFFDATDEGAIDGERMSFFVTSVNYDDEAGIRANHRGERTWHWMDKFPYPEVGPAPE